MALRQVFESAGHFVVSAANGLAALQALQMMSRPDLVLLDINMPLMNGDQFLDEIEALPELKGLRIVQMSAANNPRRSRVSHAITKPMDEVTLLGLLDLKPAV